MDIPQDPETRFGEPRRPRRRWLWSIGCMTALSAVLALGLHDVIKRGQEAAARAH